MEDVIEFAGDNLAFWRYLLPAVLACVAFWLAGLLVTRRVGPALLRRIDGDKHPYTHILIEGFRRPVGLYLQVAGVCVALLIIGGFQPVDPPAGLSAFLAGIPAFVYRALRIAAILIAAWGLLASSDVAGLLLRKARSNLDLNMSKSVTRFLGAIFKVVVIALAAVILLNEMRFDVNGLIAGLGLGGLTIALAAKDAASNFFGGLVLVAEKPFEIGDWVQSGEVDTDSILVRFADFGESSLKIRVMFYTTHPGFDEHMRIRERINFALIDLAERDGVEFAIPARSLYIEREEPLRQDGGNPLQNRDKPAGAGEDPSKGGTTHDPV